MTSRLRLASMRVKNPTPNGRMISIGGKKYNELLKSGKYRALPSGELIEKIDLSGMTLRDRIDLRDVILKPPQIDIGTILATPKGDPIREEWRHDTLTYISKKENFFKMRTKPMIVDTYFIVRLSSGEYETYNSGFVADLPLDIPLSGNSTENTVIKKLISELLRYDQYTTEYKIISFRWTIRDALPSELGDVKLYALTLKYLNVTKDQGLENCMLVHLFNEIKMLDNKKTFTIKKLKQQFLDIGIDPEQGLSAHDTLKLIKKKYSKKLSLKAYDPFKEPFLEYTSSHRDRCVAFIVNDGHCHGVEENKNEIASKGKVAFEYKMENVMVVNYDDDELHKIIHDVSYIPPKPIVIVEGITSVRMLFVDVCKETGYHIENYHYNNVQALDWFVYPKKDIIIMVKKDYREVEYACDKLKYLNQQGFINTGQSLPQIAKELYKTCFDMTIPESNYSSSVKNLLKDYWSPPPHYYHEDTNDLLYEQGLVCIDQNESYDNRVLEIEKPAPILNSFSVVEPYDGGDIKCGLYVLKEIKWKRDQFAYPSAIHSYTAVEFFLGKGIITKDDIIAQIVTKDNWDCKDLKDFVRRVKRIFPRSSKEERKNNEEKDLQTRVSKDITRTFYGLAGSRVKNVRKSFVTNDLETIDALKWEYPIKNPHPCGEAKFWSDEIIKGWYFGTLEVEEILSSGLFPLHCHIISQTLIGLVNMIDEFKTPESVCLGYCTDSLLMLRPKWVPDKNDPRYKIEGKKNRLKSLPFIQKPDIQFNDENKDVLWKEELPNVYVDKKGEIVGMTDAEILELCKKSFLCTGAPGYGKTYLLNKLVPYFKKLGGVTLYTSFTKTGVANLKGSGISEAMTLDSAIHSCKINKAIRIIIDEVFAVPQRIMSKLMLMKGVIFILLGDPNQTGPVHSFTNEYIEEFAFAKLAGHRIMRKKFIPGFGRYSEKFNKCLINFIETGIVDDTICNNISNIDDVDLHFAWENEEVKRINDHFLPGAYEARDKWFIGQRIIANRSNKLICNSRLYRITDIKDKTIKVADYFTEIEVDKFFDKNIFNRAFAITIHKAQCMTINEPFCIHQVNLLIAKKEKKLLYTAMSRASEESYVRFISKPDNIFLNKDVKEINKHIGEKVKKGKIMLGRNKVDKKMHIVACKQDDVIDEEEGMVYSLVCNVLYVELDNELDKALKYWIKEFSKEEDYVIKNKECVKKESNKFPTLSVKLEATGTAPFEIKDDVKNQRYRFSYDTKGFEIRMKRISYKVASKESAYAEIKPLYDEAVRLWRLFISK